MSEPGLSDDEDYPERLELGRPRPEPRELMTAKQLVYAYVEARTDEDREYAAVEAESFLYSLGEGVATAVLVTMLQLPAQQGTWPVVELVGELLAERAPAVVPTLLRVALERAGAASDNATAVLDGLPLADLALGLIQTLAGDAEDPLKEAAGTALVALGRPAANEILDGLVDPDVRPWIVWASGAGDSATDADVLRRIVEASAAGPK